MSGDQLLQLDAITQPQDYAVLPVITELAILDRCHFSNVRPNHVDSLSLTPSFRLWLLPHRSRT